VGAVLDYDFHPPDDLRLFTYDRASVLRFDEAVLIAEADHGGNAPPPLRVCRPLVQDQCDDRFSWHLRRAAVRLGDYPVAGIVNSAQNQVIAPGLDSQSTGGLTAFHQRVDGWHDRG
jgi:hypothetical protein